MRGNINALGDLNKVQELYNISPDELTDEILQSNSPLILKDFCSAWPLVQLGEKSIQSSTDYLMKYYRGMAVPAGYGDPEINGRIFYNEELNGFNFKSAKITLPMLLETIRRSEHEKKPPTAYMASVSVDELLPNFRQEHTVNLGDRNAFVNIWIGNRSRIAAHYDFPSNLACCLTGRRRFTLLPPDQLENLYVGPLELSPGGQEISLVDFANPDFKKFPKFERALKSAQVADLESGDALYLPGMWWHHVEAFDALNILMTHWWLPESSGVSRPMDALQLAIIAMRNLPQNQRKTWKNIFDYYVFDKEKHSQEHIPDEARGMLSDDLDTISAQKIKLSVIEKLK